MGEPDDKPDYDALYDQLEPFDLQAHIDELSIRGDPGYVLVTAAVADDWLEWLLRHHLAILSSKLRGVPVPGTGG